MGTRRRPAIAPARHPDRSWRARTRPRRRFPSTSGSSARPIHVDRQARFSSARPLARDPLGIGAAAIEDQPPARRGGDRCDRVGQETSFPERQIVRVVRRSRSSTGCRAGSVFIRRQPVRHRAIGIIRQRIGRSARRQRRIDGAPPIGRVRPARPQRFTRVIRSSAIRPNDAGNSASSRCLSALASPAEAPPVATGPPAPGRGRRSPVGGNRKGRPGRWR